MWSGASDGASTFLGRRLARAVSELFGIAGRKEVNRM